jgi:hypothetical protein
MKKEAIKKLNKDLEIEYFCSIAVLISSVVYSILYLLDFIGGEGNDNLTKFCYGVASSIVLSLLIWIIRDVKKNDTPFTTSITNKLKAIAGVVILSSVLPDLLTELVVFVGKVNADLPAEIDFDFVFASKTLFIWWLGIIIGIISEIFTYGVKLQEDSDSIA